MNPRLEKLIKALKDPENKDKQLFGRLLCTANGDYPQLLEMTLDQLNEPGAQYCVLGLALKTFNIEPSNFDSLRNIRAYLGIDPDLRINDWNDYDKLSFPEIAEKLEEIYS